MLYSSIFHDIVLFVLYNIVWRYMMLYDNIILYQIISSTILQFIIFVCMPFYLYYILLHYIPSYYIMF